MIFTVIDMRYANTIAGRFVSRQNRFTATVLINGQQEICHLKNTGRLKELLISGAEVWLEENRSPSRKTKFDLITVKKGDRYINIDSTAPNKAVREWLENTHSFGKDMQIFPERTWGDSRFDFMLKSNKTDRTIYLEVKGCTLERDGGAFFPDAPTERGVKHIRELIKCREQGFGAALLVLVQMGNIMYFSPNYETHPEFGEAMKEASRKGVELLCFDSLVTPNSLTLGSPTEIRLDR